MYRNSRKDTRRPTNNWGINVIEFNFKKFQGDKIMEIWKRTIKKTRALVGIKCDECSKSLPETIRTLYFDVFTLEIGDTHYHFCNWKCLLKFIVEELKKEKINA